MASRETPGNVVQLNSCLRRSTRFERFGGLVAVAMAQIGNRVGDAGDRTVRMDIAGPDGDKSDRLIAGEREVTCDRADDIDVGLHRRGVEDQRCCVIVRLVARKLRAEPDDAELASIPTGGLRRADTDHAFAGNIRAQPIPAQVIGPKLCRCGRPSRVADPAAGPVLGEIVRPDAVEDIGTYRWIVHDTGVLTLQPVVPPAQGLLQEANLRVRNGEMRVLVGPRTDNCPNRRFEAVEQARNGIGIGVIPTANGEHRGFDLGKVLTDRAVVPVVIAVRMPQPFGGEERFCLQALHPDVEPGIADNGRVRRARRVGEHGSAPTEILVDQAATLVVDIVGIPIVGGAQGDDRLQRFRPECCDLQSVEAAPGDADHADVAGTPVLCRDPVDDLERVPLFLRRILVEHDAVTFTIAAHVDTQAGITMAGKVGVGELITNRRAVALAVRQILEDGRHRGYSGIVRQPHTGGQPAAVREFDPDVLVFRHRMRKLIDRLHVFPTSNENYMKLYGSTSMASLNDPRTLISASHSRMKAWMSTSRRHLTRNRQR